jgi:hypothetical protein
MGLRNHRRFSGAEGSISGFEGLRSLGVCWDSEDSEDLEGVGSFEGFLKKPD